MASINMQRNRAINSIREAAERQAHEIAEFIAINANLNAPTDADRPPSHKGKRRLKGSYRARKIGDTWTVVSATDYWAFVEYGTRRQAEKPHVRTAILQARMRYDR